MAKKEFSIKNLLNTESLYGIETDTNEENLSRAKLKIFYISVHDLVPSENNFYSVDNIADLKMSIEIYGVKQNLTVKPLENGKYEIITGHRRYFACMELLNEGKKDFELVPCDIEHNRDETQNMAQLILTNSTIRELTDYEKTRQAEELRKYFEALKKQEGLPGRVRDLIAEKLKTSPANIGRMNAINDNLSAEFMQEFKDERLGLSAAFELSGLPESKQKEAFEEYTEKGGLSVGDVKAIKSESPPLASPPMPARWRAEENKLYYYINEHGSMITKQDERKPDDDNIYNSGNYFRTREAAEVYAAKWIDLFRQNLK